MSKSEPVTFEVVFQKMVDASFPYSWIIRFNARGIADPELRGACCAAYMLGGTAAVLALFTDYENNHPIGATGGA